MNKFTGVIAPNITIFQKNGSVDLAKTGNHMEWMIKKGVEGFFLTGSYGSGPLMSVEERQEIYKIALELKKKYRDLKLIANIGCIDTGDSLRLLQFVNEQDIDAVASAPPYYYNYTNEEIFAYYKTLYKQASLPLYIYNNPVATGFKFNLYLINQLKGIGISGMKDSSLDVLLLSTLLSENDDNFDIILGTSTGWLPFCKFGINCMIAGMCNYAPEIITNLYKYTKEDNEKANTFYQEMLKLNYKIKKVNSIELSMVMLKLRGFDNIYSRKPIDFSLLNGNIYKECEKEVLASFKELNLVFDRIE